ncbi:hypothetical protein [Aliikangiella sp. G2MR2-5]|uniref:hypothetical protein n=1 Tax=Aliikangiella sp. G2MR2-5 TaxID=2788943 RepID=UPI0018A951EC|nr:hypothetical protein [Aliikangiella sp. G2MR2-5]
MQDEENDENWHDECRNRIYQLAVRTMKRLKTSGICRMVRFKSNKLGSQRYLDQLA